MAHDGANDTAAQGFPMGNWVGAVQPFGNSKESYGFTVAHTDAPVPGTARHSKSVRV